MLKTVFTHLYNYRTVKEDEKKTPQPQLQIDPGTELLPICEGKVTMVNLVFPKKFTQNLFPDHKHKKEFTALTDIAQIVFINSNLPLALQNEWRFLFSSQIHGESFSTLLGIFFEDSLEERQFRIIVFPFQVKYQIRAPQFF
jgi:hypothetical protein